MQRNKKILELIMTCFILVCSFYIGRIGADITASGSVKDEKGAVIGKRQAVVIDAGHGGADSGKVGVNGALEKEINLEIAQKLAAFLETEGIEAIMTRETDAGLYDEGEANKKQQDMKRRCEMIDGADALLAVSIHQNSYTASSVKGPQVFYYENSVQGREIAAILQETLNAALEIAKPREIKANDSYYILRKTTNPTVIVECGFLSNPQEAQKLVSEAYQEQVAKAICEGILKYLAQENLADAA